MLVIMFIFRLEIDFHAKANEIEYIRKLIRMKQLLTHPKPKVKKPVRDKPVVLVVQEPVVPDLPAVEEPEEIKSQPPPPKISARIKGKVAGTKECHRDKWLYRQSSTVQLNPAINGRQRWYDNQVRKKFH